MEITQTSFQKFSALDNTRTESEYLVPNSPAKQKREWAAHIWVGADLFAWLKMMHRGRYAFGLKQAHLFLVATAINTGHTFLRYAQQHLYGERIRDLPFVEDPIFILGHWRSGTTLLHEYLILDDRYAYPSTSDCFDPCHPLLTAEYVKQYFSWLLPKKRFMDNMLMGWDRPQEDEFAMCLLGAPSPYLRLAFPNSGPVDELAYDLDGLPKPERIRWEKTFFRWLKMMNYRHRKPLVLKSPPHTCRIPTLLKMFPRARFVHLVRNPYTVYQSTVNLWKTLHEVQGLHHPHHEGIEEYVFDRFVHFHERYQATKELIPSGQLVEIRFEDLVAKPTDTVDKVYQELNLGSFDAVRPKLEAYLSTNAHYERNKWTFPADLKAQIASRWAAAIEHYGYKAPDEN